MSESSISTELYYRLENQDAEVRRKAVEEIAGLKDQAAAADHLLPLLLKEKSSAVVEAIAHALAETGGRATVSGLIALLGSEDARLRNLASEILVELRGQSKRLILELFKHKEHEIRKLAVDIAGRCKDPDAVTQLIELLHDRDINVACSAAESLGNIGDLKAVEALIALARKQNRWPVEFYAVVALGKLNSPAAIDFLISQLNSADSAYRCVVVEALGETQDKKAVSYLIPLLQSEDLLLQKSALRALGKIDLGTLKMTLSGTTHPRHLALLQSAFTVDDCELCQFALIAGGTLLKVDELLKLYKKDIKQCPFIISNLIEIGKKDIDLLLSCFKNENKMVRELIVTVLGDVQNPSAVRILLKAFKDESRDVRSSAARSIGKLGIKENGAQLLELLKDNEPKVRSNACVALGWLRYEPAVLHLLKVLGDREPEVAESALSALVMIGDSFVRDSLFQWVKTSTRKVRLRCLSGLGCLRKDNRILEVLLGTLKDEDWEIRKIGVEALGKYAQPSLLTSLEPLLQDPVDAVRVATVKVLGRIQQPEVADWLLTMLTDRNLAVRYETIRSLAKYADEKVALALTECLSSKESILQIAACEALGDLSWKPAQEKISDLLHSKDPDVRQAAAHALQSLH